VGERRRRVRRDILLGGSEAAGVSFVIFFLLTGLAGVCFLAAWRAAGAFSFFFFCFLWIYRKRSAFALFFSLSTRVILFGLDVVSGWFKKKRFGDCCWYEGK
jgi:hypothetical protein